MDFEAETRKHIQEVGKILQQFAIALLQRAEKHDNSKLVWPERKVFEEFTPQLAATTYGSEEYKQGLEKMKPALTHHYKVNRHHPESHENGVDDMNLVDLVEMFCDWIAASKRHNDGNAIRSVVHNKERFNMAEQLTNILLNTVDTIEDEGAEPWPS